jgi:ribonuclease T1
VRRVPGLSLLGLVALLLVAVLFAGCALVGGSVATPPSTPEGVPATAVAELPAGWSGGTILIEALPPEAIHALLLIEAGGPFPYFQDDGTFQNREGRLPDHPSGYYREYTVETPGSPDRGARRIVVGADGERYYTDDHYELFRFIVGEPGS